MIRSMTAFSRQETSSEVADLVLELRTVNHRYLDISLRMPEELRNLEPLLREQIAARLGRGKLECNLRYNPPELSQIEFPVDDERVKRIAHACRHIDSFLYSPAPISSLDVLRMPGVVQSKPVDLEQLKTVVTELLAQALDALVAVREREGQKLAQ